MGVLTNQVFNFSNFCSQSGDQTNLTSFSVKLVRGFAIDEKLGINFL